VVRKPALVTWLVVAGVHDAQLARTRGTTATWFSRWSSLSPGDAHPVALNLSSRIALSASNEGVNEMTVLCVVSALCAVARKCLERRILQNPTDVKRERMTALFVSRGSFDTESVVCDRALVADFCGGVLCGELKKPHGLPVFDRLAALNPARHEGPETADGPFLLGMDISVAQRRGGHLVPAAGTAGVWQTRTSCHALAVLLFGSFCFDDDVGSGHWSGWRMRGVVAGRCSLSACRLGQLLMYPFGVVRPSLLTV
jgi:hypothetical protein